MNMADRLLDFWQAVYIKTQDQIVARDGTSALVMAPKLAAMCATAADEAERQLVRAIRRHCGECAASGRVYGVGLPVEGKPCEKCAGKGLLPWHDPIDTPRAVGMLSPFGGVIPAGPGPGQRP